MNFPPVEGGKGDPSDTVGNPGQYLSISSKATADAEGDREEVLRHRGARRRRGQGVDRRPAACRSSRAPTASSAGSTDADFLKFVYDIVEQRQGLRPVLGPGAEPDRGRDAAGQHRQAVPAVDLAAAVRRQHERGHRQMTTLAPPAARVDEPASPTRRAERLGRLDGAAGAADVHRLRRHPAARRAGAELHHVGRHRRRSTPSGLDQLAGRAHRPGPAARAVGDLPGHGPVLGGPDPDEHPDRRVPGRRTSATAGSWRCSTSSRCCSARRPSPITYKALLDPNFGLGAGLGIAVAHPGLAGPAATSPSACVVFVVSWQFIPFHSLIYQGGGAADPDARCTRPPRSTAPAGSGSSSASRCRSSSTRSSPRRR